MLDGRDITNLPPQKRGFGMVFQHYALFPHMSVEDNVAFGLEARGVAKATRVERAHTALDSVGLGSAGKRGIQSLSGGEHRVDYGLFPIEGASQVARGSTNAVSIVAAVEPGGFAQLPSIWYVEKIVAGPAARGGIDLDDPIADNLRRIAFARDARVQDLTVAILDRPRHQDLMAEVAAAGARILTLEEGDIAGAVMAAVPGSGIDAAIGISGVDATLIAACAIRCLGGELQARLWPRNEEERLLIGDAAGRVYSAADLVTGNDLSVVMTGVTGGPLLPGVMFGSGYAETASLLMSSRQATIRRLTTRHHTLGDPS